MASLHQWSPAQPGCRLDQPSRLRPRPLEALSQITVSVQLCKRIVFTLNVLCVCLSFLHSPLLSLYTHTHMLPYKGKLQ